ncbi:MAG: hypothetical protein RLZZ502_1576 [Pseudomonadota bacterium]
MLPELAPPRWWQIHKKWQRKQAAHKHAVSRGLSKQDFAWISGVIGLAFLAAFTPSIAKHFKKTENPPYQSIRVMDSTPANPPSALWSPAPSSELAPTVPSGHSEAEQHLLSALAALRQAQLKTAEAHLDAVLAKYPNFRLAYLLKGDILLARTRPLQKIGEGLDDNEVLKGLRDEAKIRASLLTQGKPLPSDHTLLDWPTVPPHVRYALAVDIAASRLYVLERDEHGLHPILDMYTTVGKAGGFKTKEGDVKTPVGVYTLLAQVSKDKLTDFYGAGAFTLDYPNEWDKLNGRSGYGIWIHGVPANTFARAPRASDGCIVVANQDLAILQNYLNPGSTPVYLAQQLQWKQSKNSSDKKSGNDFDAAFSQWRKAADTMQAEQLLSSYAVDAVVDGSTPTDWPNRLREWYSKDKGNASIQLKPQSLSVLKYPSTQELMQVNFSQEVERGEQILTLVRKQYWQKSAHTQKWQIIYEGNS